MAEQQIVEYIKNTEEQGFSKGDIKKALKSQGWGSKEIKDAIKEAEARKKEIAGRSHAQPAQQPKQEGPQPAQPAGTGQQENPSQKPSGGIKKRNPFLVLIFTIITAGIYGIYWLVSTTNELKGMTGSAPNPWLLISLIIPPVGAIVMIYYYWKYSKAINELTGFNNILLFILWIVLGPVAIVLSQMQLNKKA